MGKSGWSEVAVASGWKEREEARETWGRGYRERSAGSPERGGVCGSWERSREWRGKGNLRRTSGDGEEERCGSEAVSLRGLWKRHWVAAVAELGRRRRLNGGSGGARSAAAAAATAAAIFVSCDRGKGRRRPRRRARQRHVIVRRRRRRRRRYVSFLDLPWAATWEGVHSFLFSNDGQGLWRVPSPLIEP